MVRMPSTSPLVRHALAGVLAALFATWTGPTGSGALAAQDSYALSGDRVAVYNLAGRVEVVSGDANDVRVDVVRGGADAREIEVGVRRVNGRQALVLRYPDDDVVYPVRGGRWNTTVRVRDDGTFFGDRRGGERVRVRGAGSGLEAWADLRITVPASRDLAVFLAVGDAEVRDVEGDLLLDMGSGNAAVRGVRGMVEVDTGSGDVHVAEVEGEVLVDTGSGSVRLDDVQGPAVTVDTGSGDVEGRGVVSPSVVFDTGSGDVTVDGLDVRDLRVDTGSGDIRLGLSGPPEQVSVDTGSGRVEMELPRGVDALLTVDTGSGRIEADVPMDVIERERDELRARIGEGRGRIVIDTGSGNVVLRGG